MGGEAQIRIDLSSTVPVYRQIVEQVRTSIVEGLLPPGVELPSVRRLAIDLGIHFNTVAQAYRTLGEEGWLDVSQGRGARVIARPSRRAAGAEDIDDFRERVRHLAAEARGQGIPVPRIVEELRSLAKGLETGGSSR